MLKMIGSCLLLSLLATAAMAIRWPASPMHDSMPMLHPWMANIASLSSFEVMARRTTAIDIRFSRPSP